MPRRRVASLPTPTPLPPPSPDAFPAVCRAGDFQFAPGQTHLNGCVQSRALFWCKSGHGRFTVNHVSYSLEPHDLYVLPWNRRIEYFASKREPMFTAHVHIVPWLRHGAGWEANVPHEVGEPLHNDPDRSDVPWPGYDDVVRLHIEAASPLGCLINYSTRWFRDSPRLEDEGRALGVLFMRELQRFAERPPESRGRLPEELRRLLVHINRCFHESPTVEQLAGILGRSRSHVLKLFRKHLNTSPKAYIIERQMREARELLTSTTLAISEVGLASGISDPYHFSKLFHHTMGMSPTEFRRMRGPMSVGKSPSTHEHTPPPPAPRDERGS